MSERWIFVRWSVQAARMRMSLTLKDVLKRLPEEMRYITSLNQETVFYFLNAWFCRSFLLKQGSHSSSTRLPQLYSSVCVDDYSGGKVAGGVTLTTHSHLVAKLGLGGVNTATPPHAAEACRETFSLSLCPT
jgi:hypothetical protein